jgi:DNA-directed RNA polymerase specialized sigma subunit
MKKPPEKMKKREKEIISLRKKRFTLKEIGTKYGITKQAIYGILKRIEARTGKKVDPTRLK